MDLLARRVVRGGVELDLTRREFELLEFLLRHKNATVTRDMIAREVWKDAGGTLTNTIDVYVNLLRKKVERPGGKQLIHTVPARALTPGPWCPSAAGWRRAGSRPTT